jgi:hypothetical protein
MYSVRLFFAFFLLSLRLLPVFAQSNYAALSGTVFDPQRQAVTGASLQLVSLSTGALRQVSSDEQGEFQITGLLPGEYKLTVQATGFAPLTKALRLEVGQQMNLSSQRRG